METRDAQRYKNGLLINGMALALLSAAYLAIAFERTRGIAPLSVVNWMYIYDVADVRTWQEAVAFFRELRTGISPILAFLEIFSNLVVSGGSHTTLSFVYQWSIIGSFLLAFLFGRRPLIVRCASAAIGLIFLSAIVVIHPCNAQLYDIVYPLLLLLYVSCLSIIRRVVMPWLVVIFSIVAGFAVTFMELSRPFVLLLLPLMLAGGWWALRRRGWKTIAVFFLPILLFSGGWHLKLLFLNGGQILWSNHSGYNVMRVWDADRVLPYPPLIEEIHDAPLAPGREKNLNTSEHAINSSRIGKTIVWSIVRDPIQSIRTINTRLWGFLRPATTIYQCTPHHVPRLYGAAVHISFLWVIVGLFGVLYGCWVTKSIQRALEPENLLMILTIATIALLALGEAGEEARFIVSVLPLLAALPVPTVVSRN